MNSLPKYLILLLISSLVIISCNQEEPKEPDPVRRKSPTAIARINHADTYIKITYGQPYRNGRVIFGELEPYGEVWRTGANEATEITTTEDILLSGNELKAGTYTLFTIPGEEKWTIIVNNELGQWGAFEYDASEDEMRFDVQPITTRQATEVFIIQFEEAKEDSTAIIMKWDQIEVRIPVEFMPPDPA